MKTTVMIVTTLALLVVVGCGTWEGLGKDVSKTGDVMAGEGEYVMTVQATPDRATAAARKAVEQLNMTDIESSGDRGRGTVTARTQRQDKVKIDIEQLGERDSTVTIYTYGDDADTVRQQIQGQIINNLR